MDQKVDVRSENVEMGKVKMRNISNTSGFSFSELMVAMGVLALLVPVLFSLFFVSLQSQAKTRILAEVKRNGDFTLSTLEYNIKNNIKAIYSDQEKTAEVCTVNTSVNTPVSFEPTLPDTIYFDDQNGNLFYYALSGTQIASYSATINPNPVYLTSSKVEATNFIISCLRGSTFSPPIVAVSFTVSNLPSANRHEEKATLNYQTKIKLRSY